MTFGAPLALLGLIAVALPIAIHLLSRNQAKRLRFPTVRFLPVSPILARRRIRLTEPGLLAIRAGILAFAALALAQPRLTGRALSLASSSVSRLILVDSSASMGRPMISGGKAARDSAEAIAESLASSSAVSLRSTSPSMRLVMPAGIDWLRKQIGRRELVVISDFQSGVIDSADLASVPTDAGIRLVRIPTVIGGDTLSASVAGRTVRMAVDRGHTMATWLPGVSSSCAVELLTSRARREQAEGDLRLASSVRPCDSTAAGHPAAIIYMEYDRRADLVAAAKPLDAAWMAAAAQRLHDDPALREAASLTPPGIRDSLDSRFSVITRDSADRPLLLASSGSVSGPRGLQLWWLGEPGIGSTALMAALPGALGNPTSVDELDPAYIPADRLQKWERPPTSSAQPVADGGNGRWLWGAALLLLLLEGLVRRRRRVTDTTSSLQANDMERAA